MDEYKMDGQKFNYIKPKYQAANFVICTDFTNRQLVLVFGYVYIFALIRKIFDMLLFGQYQPIPMNC